jgi:2-polyprenyl-6-methoxyphenol hydroxylase-like FAD-dependent oxidoreductase
VSEHFDVVIVGGGIAGGALATVLARAGKRALVLEKTAEYRDRVRGEWIAPWGVAELNALGLYDTFIAAGGHHVTKHVPYGDAVDPATAEAAVLDMTGLLPGIPGPLTIGHPKMCELLHETSLAAGATALRGVSDIVRLTFGASPSVTYVHDGAEHTATCRLIVGADGRGSIVRRAAGIDLHRDPTHHLFSGMLVEGADGWPADTQALGAEGDVHFLAFPQGHGRVRLYLGYSTEQPQRLAGARGQQAFLDAFRLKSVPGSEHLANARPAGPCNSYPNEDTWTDAPCAEGVVLVGDAAGHNDPIIGQGLSITFRDVRIVRDILLAGDDWSASAFAPYAVERRERMRRLRFSATLQSRLETEFGPEAEGRRRRAFERRAQDPTLMLPALATMLGPERMPAEAFEDAVMERTLA